MDEVTRFNCYKKQKKYKKNFVLGKKEQILTIELIKLRKKIQKLKHDKIQNYHKLIIF